MRDYAKTLKVLIILDKLLKQDFISLKKSWGDADVIKEINDEIKQFISNKLDSMIKETPLVVSVTSSPAVVSADVKAVTAPVVNTLVQSGFNPAAELKDRIEFIKKHELELKGKK